MYQQLQRCLLTLWYVDEVFESSQVTICLSLSLLLCFHLFFFAIGFEVTLTLLFLPIALCFGCFHSVLAVFVFSSCFRLCPLYFVCIRLCVCEFVFVLVVFCD